MEDVIGNGQGTGQEASASGQETNVSVSGSSQSAGVDNQQTSADTAMNPNYRAKLMERLRSYYPERRFREGEGEDGDEMEQGMYEMLQEMDESGRLSEMFQQDFVKVFSTDPLCANFFMEWIRTGEPRRALVRIFGDDIAELATEEGRNQFSDSLQEWRSRKAADEAIQQESEKNWGETLEAINQWAEEKGYGDDEVNSLMLQAMDIVEGGLMRKFDPGFLETLVRASRYDEAVRKAREEGELAGRNAKIQTIKRNAQRQAERPPAIKGGQGSAPVKKERTNKTIWDIIKD